MLQGTVRREALVLLSGGIDSATCVGLYQHEGYQVSSLFVDLGHAAAKQEELASARVAAHYGVQRRVAHVRGIAAASGGYVPARNGLLLQLSLAMLPFEAGHVVLGIHHGPNYPDCGPAFVKAMQRVFDVYTDGRAQIAAPFLKESKQGVLQLARRHGVPLTQTYSCEVGGSDPCRHCSTCLDLVALGAL